MSYPDGPNVGRARILCSHPKPGIVRIEYSVLSQANCSLAWKVFSDWHYWHKFSDVYGGMEWRGAPWEPGSRLQIQIVKPLETRVNLVITICEPSQCVAWIEHVMGYTMQQWVLFDPSYKGGSKISTWVEFTGEPSSLECRNLGEFLQNFIEQWYGNFAAECDRLARAI